MAIRKTLSGPGGARRHQPGAQQALQLRVRTTFFGWRIVATAAVVAAFGYGAGLYGPGVYLHALQTERGWSVSTVSSAATAHFLIGAALVAFLPDAYRRLGLAGATRAGVALLAAGALAWACARQPWQLFGAALLSGMGWAATGGAAVNAMIAPWFERRRPIALALAFNGASLGGIAFPPLWVALAAMLGLAGAGAAVGAAALLAIWPLAGRYLRPTPAALGLAPDGESTPPAAGATACLGAAPPAGAAQAPAAAPAGRAALLRDRRFATMAPAGALGMFALLAVYAHLVALLAPRLGETAAAGAVSLASACTIAGRIVVGWLLGGGGDRRLAAAAGLTAQGCGAALLMAVAAMSAAATPVVAVATILGCALTGLGGSYLVSLVPLIAQAEFPRADVQRVVALALALNQGFAALAPGTLGALRDAVGGYAAPFALAAAAPLAGAVLVLAGRSRRLQR